MVNNINKDIFRTYDIRGIVDRDFSDELVITKYLLNVFFITYNLLYLI